MSSSHPEKLTQLAISRMLQGDAEEEDMVVQVYDINTTKNGRVMCSISDGEYYTKAYLNDDKIVKPANDQFSIVRVKSHGVLKNNIGVTDLKFVAKYPEKLGSPVDWSSCKENAADIKSHQEFRLEKLERVPKTEPKKMQMPSAAKTSTGKDSQYQSIDDLHIGLNRWTILCRITKKQFKQSAKKGTKILQIELVDKSKKRIIGTFFHEAAVDFNDYLREGAIYEISKGRIIEGDYNNSKNQKFSPYRLTFDGKSQFNEVSDVNIIAKSEDTAITLGNLYERKTLNQEFDVVAYIVEIKDQATFQKDGKQFKVKQVIVADPEANITMKVSLWRWNHEIGSDMVGKVVIFSRFILKQYKGCMTLYSGIRSSIITTHGHSMKKYENRHLDTSSFTQVSASAEYHEKGDEDTSEFCFNTKELNDKINRMGYHDTIKSNLFVWINRFAVSKKWNYEGCPKCKKAAEKYSKCANCGQAIEQTALHFSMGVEVSDGFGSIWITAYDEFAKKIFSDMGASAVKQLQELQRDALNEKLENYAYQPFRIKIITKKDEEGRIRHNAGKLLDLNQERVARQNMKKIYQMMGVSH